ncbi:MAG TPA: hypothetical protein VN679_15240 [Candidatus Acidoferrales bacterium]|nr:hypothetical protein [Candidatus Acidoferrales bacterium]
MSKTKSKEVPVQVVPTPEDIAESARIVQDAEMQIPGGFHSVIELHRGERSTTPILSYVEHIKAVHWGLSYMQNLCYRLSYNKGWHNGYDGVDPYVFATKIALIHSELSEALEGHRKDLQDDHLPHRKAVEVELADAIIRIFDLAGAAKLDVASAVIEKLVYNQHRADHEEAARNGVNGKRY